MKIRMAIPALVALLMATAAGAQTGSVSAKAADPASTKTGVINVQVAIQSTAEGKQASAELQSQFAPRSTELDNTSKQIQDIQTRLRTGQTTLSDEEKARLTREGEVLTRNLNRKQQEFQDDAQEAQREVVDRIGRKMIDVLDKYAKESGYVIIFDTSAQTTPVIYAANQIDVTQEIIRLYDQTYPVKGGAPARSATQRPATPKPAAPQPGQTPPKN
jgi:outer membrane protein